MTTWHKGGIYSKARTDADGTPYEQYFVRVFIDKRPRVFKAGRTMASANRVRDRVRGNPEKAMQKRQEDAVKARGTLTVAALCRGFLGTYVSRGQTAFYRHSLRAFSDYFGPMAADDVNEATLDKYRQKREAERTKSGERRIGISTVRKETHAVALMFRWAKKRGRVAANPLAEYDHAEEPIGAPARPLSYAEEDALLAALPPLERDVMTWALDTGMRRGEILSLKWPCIDRASKTIYVVTGSTRDRHGNKTDKIRSIPLDLSDRLGAILKRHPQRIGTDLLFHDRHGNPLDTACLDRVLIAAMRKAGIPRVRGSRWNVLRKTWVNRIYNNGAKPEQEAEWGGHTITVAMRHYREHSPTARMGATGLLNRATVASTVAGNV